MSIESENKKLVKKLVLVPVAMFCFAFALVPIYNVLCDATGLNGKPSLEAYDPLNVGPIDTSRTITVEFVTTVNEQNPWEFRASKQRVELHPGEVTELSYYVKNLTDKDMVVQAIPSVTPGLASSHLKKIECFCFSRQELPASGERDMPLKFVLSPKIPKHINTLTLSYTLFDQTKA